jgi:putative hemin transport protein
MSTLTSNKITATKIKTLGEKWEDLKISEKGIRIRNAAEKLNVSEVELLATQCGNNVIRLNPNFQDILAEVESLGKVMALSRNNEVVHERKGVYLNPSLDNPHVGLFVGEDIDLRLFFGPWKSAFAVTEGTEEKPRYSLQFFAADGEAIHKIYLTPQSNLAKYNELVNKYKSENQENTQTVETFKNDIKELHDSEINQQDFQNDWVNLKDTHHFFGLLKKYNLTRTQALRLAPKGNYAVKVNTDALTDILNKSALSQTEIMVFVGNKGVIQIHTGAVHKIVEMNGWLNVLDPDFNLHILSNKVTDMWVVRKPTEDGMVTALECFNNEGEQVVQLFGKRKPGIPELSAWQNIVQEIENTHKID